MADEWSKPVKEADGRWTMRLGEWNRAPFVSVSAEDVYALSENEGALSPRDVVLRLLAAEASDRLGWVWDIANFGGVLGWIAQGSTDDEPRFRWIRGDREHEPVADRTTVFRPLPANSPDELLAAQHGYFLLADAIREAGQ